MTREGPLGQLESRRTRAPAVAWLVVVACASNCHGPDGIERISPASGRRTGGEPIRIEGRGFSSHGAAVVYLGEEPAKAVVIESDRLMVVRSPESHEVGVVDVTVELDDGTSYTSPAAFTMSADTAIRIGPSH